ncbi:MAG TPA: DUF1501 domain-containing protein [Planctomycetota bacterium]|nr:DUF1501 domain-containing protein [Planctomycetota bacterium]
MQRTRRSFLVAGLQVGVSLPVLSALGWPRARGPRPADGARALVVVQLTGGNDGLATLVPHRQDAYYRLRPTLAPKPAALVALDDDHGLHPALAPLRAAHAAGRLAAVHGVGVPHPDRSHFRSMEIWHTADPDHPPGPTGWMGRLADRLGAEDPEALIALHVGDGELPLALRARSTFAPSVVDPAGFHLAPAAEPIAAARAALLEAGRAEGELAYLRRAAAASYAAAERMDGLTEGGTSDYPDTLLAAKLRLVARLLAGGFGARLFHLELGGFDTHARQAPLHAALLTQLGAALAAFDRDLAERGLDSSVTTFVFSEFGRRAEENGSKGTDHGAGAPVFLLGGSLRAGLHGTPPDLERLVDGDVPATTDLRGVIGALEHDWLGQTPSSQAPRPALLS